MKNIHKIKENIYITSDEEIKVNDYITDGYIVWKWQDDSSLLGRKKIILTTDQDLIKDGVQAIDDEFLEWFVRNPSCEFVFCTKTSKVIDLYADDEKDKWEVKYELITPKEEQKQHLIDMMKADEELGLYEETIIQAKYRLYKEHWNEDHTQLVKSNFLNGFDEGVKWQQERMYSEEDMLKSFMAGIKCESNKGENFEQFIKQFKKKRDYDTKK